MAPKFFDSAPQQGSWKATAIVMAGLTGLYIYVGTAPKDTPIGNLISSAYDYVISETLGFHVDYDKTLGQQYEELKGKPDVKRIPQAKFDTVVEKCEASIKAMHRPIVMSETAEKAESKGKNGRAPPRLIGHRLDQETYEHIAFTDQDSQPREIIGRVSSYNVNTFKGRIYVSYGISSDLRSVSLKVCEARKT